MSVEINDDELIVEIKQPQEIEEERKPKQIKNFMYYYNNDADFKEKHKKKICEKVACECGSSVARGNLYNHRKTKKHNQFMEALERVRNEKRKYQKRK